MEGLKMKKKKTTGKQIKKKENQNKKPIPKGKFFYKLAQMWGEEENKKG